MCLPDKVPNAGAEVAFVTGCGSGIGKALALELSQLRTKEGKPAFQVVATDINFESLKPLEKEGISIIQLDVTNVDSINTAVQKVLLEKGRIDLLVCNAGLCYCGWVAELDYKRVERMFDVNVHGVFKVVQAVAPHMMDRKAGKIAVMCSVNSWVVRPFVGPYSGTKAALSVMTDALRMELYPFDVNVIKVVPGWVKSDIINEYLAQMDSYNTPKSKYQTCTSYLHSLYNMFSKMGITTQEAAQGIAKGLAKAKPSSVIKIGEPFSLYWAFFWGWVQQWTPGGVDFVATVFLEKAGLVDLHKRLHAKPAAAKTPKIA